MRCIKDLSRLPKIAMPNPHRAKPLFQRITAAYHVEDLLTRSYTERKKMIFPGTLNLLIGKILKEPFNERVFINVLLEASCTLEFRAQPL